jgi:hypothetical protein
MSDCVSQKVLVPVTRGQAQGYLPKGFSPTVGAAGQSEQVYFEFVSLMCGDQNLPVLSLVAALITVKAPARYSSEETLEQYVIDIAGAGTGLRPLATAMCVSDVVVDGQITSSHRIDRAEVGTARGNTTVESPALVATFDVAASGTDYADGSAVRWLYERDGKISYFDSAYSINFLGVGSSVIRFSQPYLDFPPVVPAGAIYDAHDQMMFVPPSDCRSTRR